ncbi:MAG: NAD(P)/FAD-dependent oxidoreductase [Xanthomonadales bacterium PRO6]|nr:Ferredoxin--NADP reductase [Xanthomonadales bacterium]MCE7932193.1 NAD(P)/FAD-dependent oxidoreductase [Xanthomonadales bacterium PRO6]
MAIETDVVIVGAGPVGLFQVFELGLLGIKAHVIDALPVPGGQCIELYPDKPIYDIPALPICTGKELTDNLMQQIAPFQAGFHLDQEVAVVDKLDEQHFRVGTSKGKEFRCRAVIIAAGLGAFQPRKLPVAGTEPYEGRQLHYAVKHPETFRGKDLVILGGGDSALDWVLALQPIAHSVVLIHRSNEFRAAPASVAKMRALVDAHQMQLLIGNVTGIRTEGDVLRGVHVIGADSVTRAIDFEHLLAFYGLSPKLGPIAQWGLGIDKNQIVVDTERFESSVPGIYAVGDINTYPGKKKLILCGFHEAALAAFAIKARMNPGAKVHLQYTTTSPIMHQRLGVSPAVELTAI